MKTRYSLLLTIIVLLFAGWSCTEKDNLAPEGNWELSDPAIVSPAANSSIVLDETKPDSTIVFTWTGASSTAGFGVYYSVVIDTAGSTSFDTPILTVKSGNSGTALSASITFSQLNEAMSLAGYPADAESKVTWAVVASCLTKSSYLSGDLSVTRFKHEIIPTSLYVSGEATETGTDLSKAIPMRRLKDANGNGLNRYEAYTHLDKGKAFKFFSATSLPAHQYGGSDGNLVKSGTSIVAPDSAVYRISVDLDNNTYALQKIDKWSIVGGIIDGGWGGDEPLQYQGGGVWKGSINLVDKGGFVFRANGDWGYLLKHIVGTDNSLIMESEGNELGIAFEDDQSTLSGQCIFTLDLSADPYTYTIERDPNAVGPVTTPDHLYLLADGTIMKELTKDGDTFTSGTYLALQSSVTYTLNSASDGSGTSYALSGNVGASDNPTADKVAGTSDLSEGADGMTVEQDQAYMLNIDFSSAKASWYYYNLKLFHWSNWDTRDEIVMTYVHPYTFTVTADLKASSLMKFNSPWDIQFGADDPSALSGTMTNNGGDNFDNLTADGNYTATIVVSDDYQTGTYEFVKN